MLDELNPQQREVAQLRQHCVAIACPGAGKTKTIATKAALAAAGQRRDGWRRYVFQRCRDRTA